MKIVIAGTGGIGGYYGALLAQGGHDVFFIARDKHLAIINEAGLTIKSHGKQICLKVNAGPDSSRFGIADLIIICFKSYDTASTFNLYRQSINEKTVILSLQNGIENETILSQELGVTHVVGGISFIGSLVEAPGVILHTAYGNITIGELDGEVTNRITAIGKMFNTCTINCKVSNNIKHDIWGKMVWNVGFNAICTILDCSAKEVLQFRDTKLLVESAMREWIEVARACGVSLAKSLTRKNIVVTQKGGEVVPSMLHDRRRGKKMEIEFLNAKVVSLGHTVGLDTPVNTALTSIIRFYNRALYKDSP